MRTAARTFSIVVNPVVSVTLSFAMLTLLHRGWLVLRLVLWGFFVLGPAALMFGGLRRGLWSDVGISQLRERRTFMPWAALFAAVAFAVTLVPRFPLRLRISAFGIFAWLLVSTVIGVGWKISLHAGSAAGVIGLVALVVGILPALCLAWAPILVAWARLHLRKHDVLQVAAGICVGSMSVLAAMPPLGAP